MSQYLGGVFAGSFIGTAYFMTESIWISLLFGALGLVIGHIVDTNTNLGHTKQSIDD